MPRAQPFHYISKPLANGSTIRIVEGESFYAVLFDGNPINEITDTASGKPGNSKYGRTCYVHRGHAENRAKKLNDTFHCQLFTVSQMIVGEQVYP